MKFNAKWLLLLLIASAACQKEIEKIKIEEVDKQYSWTEVKQLYGSQKFIVGMSKDANSIYFQQPGWFGVLTPSPTAAARHEYGYYGAGIAPISTVKLPTDVQTRIPLGSDFFAFPYRGSDSVLLAFPTAPPLFYDAGAEIHLRRLDHNATAFVNNGGNVPLQFGAISSNNYLLVNYLTKTFPDPNLHFTLSKVTVSLGQVTASTQLVSLPSSSPGNFGYFTVVAAIDDYFLVNAIGFGIYKIRQDGTASQVFGPAAVINYYKWQGIVYAVEGTGSKAVITSSDNGETWQRQTGVPDYFGFSTFRPVGDSLVGITHSVITNSLFTLRWQGNTYRVRELKNDGLGQANFTDLVQLGDTVYLGTTNGLFKRPLSTFFESQPKK